ncbi:LOW QUALITY PROTEIN: putative calcium-transporting ATPase 13, plasma membrane-type [Beta vulgaris subsp. vulgaris]|uniref:LOW QUALITY PROTEIN: putative calcium-transporting ATPase 13, plasma membrane-type n=1 Tax=Beta vulgaris subsp. vulgaris TaxID=3555 RepID=UPI0025466555|nr:LOW QUALITY PROTEIN: putative calcium-transporting ATPase 13, plasma membrane-type [Beta vulgaris subsp. vulgaris]
MDLHQRKHATHFENDLPSLIKPQKRWSLACKSVYFIVTLTKKVLLNNAQLSQRAVVRSPSYVVLDIDSHTSENTTPFSCSIDQKTLTSMTRERDLESLLQLGGVKRLAFTLGTNNALGVSSNNTSDLLHRKNVFGSNYYKKPPEKSFLSFIIAAMNDTTIIILFFCACLSLGFGMKQHGPKEGWYDGGSIIIAIFLVVSVSAISNIKQSRQFKKLSDVSSDIQVEVLRDNRRQQVSIFEVVVGDIIFLKIGDQIPADGLFLDGYSLKVDESSMTGESDHVEVNDNSNPFLFSGTKVTDGYGRMLVTSVGMNTAWGEMMGCISRELDEETPLQMRLNNLTSYIGKVGLLVASLVLLVLFIRYFTGHTKDEYGNREYNGKKTKTNDVMNAIINMISTAVTIIVVAIPEGLPLAVTLTLAYSMKKMMADNAMVRKLSACETMGSATIICTDKTGTLTLNQMSVTEFWQGKELVRKPFDLSKNVNELLHQAIGLNTTGSVCQLPSESMPEISGSPTEKAILKWAVCDLGIEMDKLNKSFEVVKVEAFNSEKKRSGVMARTTTDKRVQVHWKGAAEMILAMCSNYYDERGKILRLEEEDQKYIKEVIQKMAGKSLRCIAFAHKAGEDDEVMQELDESGLTLLGIVGIKDPCRPGVREAVESCKKAGVGVIMITGDNIFTAKAIATECGILQPYDQLHEEAVIEGIVFRNYLPEQRMEKLDHIRVMARSSPLDKLLMVQCLKKKGHVVAVTGDGTNDAPALKEADIGLSMGIQGTEVAKESSDIVILDDNFASVVTVLRWGRCVYNNIQKFIQFQLTVNVAALFINFVAAVSSGNVPLTAVQLLWVNLIMDTLGALALATEEPTTDLMKKPPVGRTEKLITKVMWRNLIAQAFYQMAVLLTLQFKGESIFGVGEKVKDTLIFNCFVFCQVFNEFNARKLEKKNVFEGILKNRLFLGIVGMTIILQVVMIEFLKKFAGTERLNWGQWSACIAIAAISWPIGWLVKCIPISSIQNPLARR